MYINRVIALLVLMMMQSHAAVAMAMTDKATGIQFPAQTNDLEIIGVGVRQNGPIKAYSVAMYSSSALKEKLASVKRSEAKKAFGLLQSGAKENLPATFVVHMNFKVGGEKIASGFADSVASRHAGDKQEVEQLKSLIVSGVQAKGGSATPGTIFEFDCTNSGVGVTVDGKKQGQAGSMQLAQAFCDSYLDDKCSSPALRQCCVDNCCAA